MNRIRDLDRRTRDRDDFQIPNKPPPNMEGQTRARVFPSDRMTTIPTLDEFDHFLSPPNRWEDPPLIRKHKRSGTNAGGMHEFTIDSLEIQILEISFRIAWMRFRSEIRPDIETANPERTR